MPTHREDVFTAVTRNIIAQLERGVGDWYQRRFSIPAPGGVTPLRLNRRPYRGRNAHTLRRIAAERGYAFRLWMTARQVRQRGGSIKPGEEPTYGVFNAAAQTTGLPIGCFAKAGPPLDPALRIGHADAFFQSTGAEIAISGRRAFYWPEEDRIAMPPFEAFPDPETFYAVLAHETCHWTGHPSRLGRNLHSRRGTKRYAREELVAELGAAVLCTEIGLCREPMQRHPRYIKRRLDDLGGDVRELLRAADKARLAVEFLLALQPDVEA
ncbi:MAG TPA: zincin-like metallopeptidase domain-containing protein [Tepidisphaeraceae bacterium]|jgi:antirestriction protein ArdC|nr:zincin-like metallopeptidase domain-containing protein [Tepidisphaeraceae bacterium]